MRINTADAEDVFELHNSHDQELNLCYIVEIRKQSAVEEADKPEPEPKEITTMICELTDGLGLIGSGIKLCEDLD